MPYFTKKPVTIEAVRYTGDNLRVVLEFTGKHRKFNEWFDSWDAYERHVEANDMEFKIFTLEGVMSARPGDWIIKGVKGEFYPCKPDIFEDTYEPAGVSAPAGVRVKPLKWMVGGFEQDADLVDTTETYQIQEGIFWYGCQVDGTRCEDNEAAKAAAQADYEQRILDALEPGQTHREGWEQAKEVIDVKAMAAPQCIRARTPDDAAAALERVKQEARNEALREALTIVRTASVNTQDDDVADGLELLAAAIAALITEGQSDGE